MLSNLENHAPNLYIKTRPKGKSGFGSVDKTRILKLSDLEGIIPGIYPFTGCDTVSVFLDKGKLKVFNLMLKDGIFIQLFQSLGTSWGLADESYILAEPFL